MSSENTAANTREVPRNKRSVKWLFNEAMWCGAVCGWLITGSVIVLKDAVNHKGPGVINGSDWRRGDDLEYDVSESGYKNAQYRGACVLLLMGLSVWYHSAKSLRHAKVFSLAMEQQLKAQLLKADAYQRAIVSVLDEPTHKRVIDEAKNSHEYQEASYNAENAIGKILHEEFKKDYYFL